MRSILQSASLSVAGMLVLFVATGAVPQAASAQASTSTVKVTISKFVDGAMATASSSQSASFPMSASWSNTGFGNGSGSFNLGPTGFNTPTPYQAVTADMASGASYAVSETVGGSTVGADCSSTQPFRVVGYSTGNTLAAAQAATVSSSSPNLTNITSDKFVIVWNRHCLQAPTPLSPANGSATTTAGQTLVDWTDVTNPVGGITYIYQASNASTTNPDGSFTNPVFTSGALTQSQIATPNTPVGTYYWHVQAKDANGNTSLWSPTWSFSVTAGSTTTPPTATSTVKVHILKYLDGSVATASSSSSFQFPMSSTWKAANLNGGATTTGSYVLGNSHGGASNQYGADTSAMQVGANYATNEVTGTSTSVLPIGATCAAGKYQILGYTTSATSFADAASKTPSATAPSFSNLTSDQYVIVWNKKCDGSQPNPGGGTGTLVIHKFTLGGNGTFSFRGNKGIGTFTIETSNMMGTKTLTGLKPGKYTVREQDQQSWRMFFNTCRKVRVQENQTAHCFVVNRVPVNQWDSWQSGDYWKWEKDKSDLNE